MVDLDLGLRPDTLPSKDDILGVVVQDVELGLKRSTTIPCSMSDKVLMAMVESDLGLRTDLLPTIIQVFLIDHQGYSYGHDKIGHSYQTR